MHKAFIKLRLLQGGPNSSLHFQNYDAADSRVPDAQCALYQHFPTRWHAHKDYRNAPNLNYQVMELSIQ
jgi:hypothetical protein